MASRCQARLEEEVRRRKVAHALAHEMQSPAGKTRVGGFLAPVLWEKLEISSRRSLRCGKKTSPESLPKSLLEKSPAVNVF